MKAVILAAGKGERFKGEVPKPLARLFGLPILEHTLRALRETIDEFIIVISDDSKNIKDYFGDGSKLGIKITYVDNPDPWRENGYSLHLTRDLINEPFLICMGDHYFERSIYSFLKEKHKENVLFVSKINEKEEATKVYVEGDFILDIGKNIEKWNAIDTGLFICQPYIFDITTTVAKEKEIFTISDVMKELIKEKELRAIRIESFYWKDIDTEEDLREAEIYIQNSLVKEDDGPVSKYINRKISSRISKFLVRYNINPNQLTIISFIFSLMPAYLFFLTQNFLAGILTQIASIVDGCDGEIARLKNLQSNFGAFLDSILDRYADFAIILGMILGNFSDITLLAGLFAIIGSLMISYSAARADLIEKKDRFNFFLIMRRDMRLFLIMLGGIFNQILLSLLVIAVISNLTVILRILTYRQ